MLPPTCLISALFPLLQQLFEALSGMYHVEQNFCCWRRLPS